MLTIIGRKMGILLWYSCLLKGMEGQIYWQEELCGTCSLFEGLWGCNITEMSLLPFFRSTCGSSRNFRVPESSFMPQCQFSFCLPTLMILWFYEIQPWVRRDQLVSLCRVFLDCGSEQAQGLDLPFSCEWLPWHEALEDIPVNCYWLGSCGSSIRLGTLEERFLKNSSGKYSSVEMAANESGRLWVQTAK